MPRGRPKKQKSDVKIKPMTEETQIEKITAEDVDDFDFEGLQQKELYRLKRNMVFMECNSKQALAQWIRAYLGLDLPEGHIYPDSNSSPLDMIWEIYDMFRKGSEDHYKPKILAYAARDSYKTLSAAILEVLCLLHFGVSCAHFAAIKSQSTKAQSYVVNFLNKTYIRDFLVGNNEMQKKITRFRHRETKDNIPTAEYEVLDNRQQVDYEKIEAYVKIIIATIQSANSEHVPFLVVDEVDVIRDRRAYEEAMMIPSEHDGRLPIVLLTSTRKFAFGLVQEEINKQDQTGLHILHWNIMDITASCPTERHQPHLPKVEIFVNDDELKAISREEYEDLSIEKKSKYIKEEGYAGCLSKCKIFASCRSRLASMRKMPIAKDRLLKSVANTQSAFERTDLDMAKAQLLCWKPTSEGLVYPYFNKEIHVLSPSKAAKLLGLSLPVSASKKDFIELMQYAGAEAAVGIDWGFTHPWCAVLGWRIGTRMVVTDLISQSGLETTQQLDQFQKAYGKYKPKVFADPENPQNVLTFRKNGVRISEWKKGAGSIKAGIEIVRRKMRPTLDGEPELVFLDTKEKSMELLIERISSYHYKTDPSGNISEDPNDEDDDENDALRYLVMNTFAKDVKASVSSTANGFDDEEEKMPTQIKTIMDKLAADAGEAEPLTQIQRKGRFIAAF